MTEKKSNTWCSLVPTPGDGQDLVQKYLHFEKWELILMNPIWKVDSKQSKFKWSSGNDNIYCENGNVVIAYLMFPEVYSEPYQRSKMDHFAGIVNTYFQKTLHVRYLTGFWIRFWKPKSLFLNIFLLLQTCTPLFKNRCAVVTAHQAFLSSTFLHCSLKTYLKTCQSIYDGAFYQNNKHAKLLWDKYLNTKFIFGLSTQVRYIYRFCLQK